MSHARHSGLANTRGQAATSEQQARQQRASANRGAASPNSWSIKRCQGGRAFCCSLAQGPASGTARLLCRRAASVCARAVHRFRVCQAVRSPCSGHAHSKRAACLTPLRPRARGGLGAAGKAQRPGALRTLPAARCQVQRQLALPVWVRCYGVLAASGDGELSEFSLSRPHGRAAGGSRGGAAVSAIARSACHMSVRLDRRRALRRGGLAASAAGGARAPAPGVQARSRIAEARAAV